MTFLTLSQAARRLTVSASTVRRAEGATVNGSFDEPGSAAIARAALADSALAPRPAAPA